MSSLLPLALFPQLRFTPPDLLALAPLVVLLIVAAVIDWRSRRIPNWLTLGLLGGGLVRGLLGTLLGPWESGLSAALLGAVAGFVLSVPLFAIGARGAGDAKLYIASGAWLGWLGVIVVFLAEAIIGGVMVIGQCLARGRLMDLLRNTGVLVMTVVHVRRVGVDQACENGRIFTSIDRRLPHAVPFLIAVVLTLAIATGHPASAAEAGEAGETKPVMLAGEAGR